MKFSQLTARRRNQTPLEMLTESVQRTISARGAAGLLAPDIARRAVALESADADVLARMDGAAEDLNAALESICATAPAFGKSGNSAAATVAGILASAPRDYLAHSFPTASADGQAVVPAQGGVSRLSQALEAYDERDNKNATAYSVAYNFQAARQDELGELFFPTVVVTPEQVGYSVTIDLVEVQNDIKRSTSGALENYGRRNIIQGLRDGSVLENEQTRIYPVARAENADKLVPQSLLARKSVTVLGEVIETAPLLFGKKLSLLGISQTDSMLASGVAGATDQVDTAVVLDNVYLQVQNAGGTTKELFVFPVARNPGATFNQAIQGNYRQMVVNFSTRSLMINKAKKTASGTDSTLLAAIASGDWKVNLSVDVNGQVNLDTSETSLNASDVTVHSVEDSTGNQYAPTDAAVQAIVELFVGAKLLSFDLLAYRSNLNRRQRGQLLNLNRFSQTYAIPLLAPVTILRPSGAGDATDTSDLGALIAATRIRTSNAAVKELLASDAALAAFVDGREHIGNVPEILSIARFLVQPYYKKLEFDAALATNSLRSQDRAKDIQAALLSVIRDEVYKAYRDSGYKAAADSLNGGASAHPMVIVGTDQVLSRYLWVEGDMRTLGIDFEMKVASSQNKDMAGKIFISFGQPEASNGVPNPLHFGNMGWRPELTLVLPLTRDGQFSKELTVQPAFRHVTNLPVLIRIDVKNLSETAVKKTAVDFHTV